MNVRVWYEAEAIQSRNGKGESGVRLRMVPAPGGVAFVEDKPAMEGNRKVYPAKRDREPTRTPRRTGSGTYVRRPREPDPMLPSAGRMRDNGAERGDRPMSTLMKVVFWFVAANALAGAGSLIFFPTDTARLFFWEIKPSINAALFGALYLGGAVAVALVTYRGRWEPARFLVPILVSAGALISVTTVVHLDLFTPGLRLAYWLVIYVGAPFLALLFYVQHERSGADWSVYRPVTPATRGLAIAVGAALVLLGVTVLIRPAPVLAQWPWTITPLMVRIFASWFAAFGVGLLWFLVEHDWDRVRHVADLMMAASGLDLLMVFVHRHDLTTVGPGLWIYCSHLALFGLIGLTMHWLQRDAARLSSAGHLISAGDHENGLPGSQSGTPTTGRATR